MKSTRLSGTGCSSLGFSAPVSPEMVPWEEQISSCNSRLHAVDKQFRAEIAGAGCIQKLDVTSGWMHHTKNPNL